MLSRLGSNQVSLQDVPAILAVGLRPSSRTSPLQHIIQRHCFRPLSSWGAQQQSVSMPAAAPTVMTYEQSCDARCFYAGAAGASELPLGACGAHWCTRQ